ncbi:MAG TPA: glycosyltransferase [Candidatus Bathyarchaeia archaeon]|nr:glycosyltransferase [Candidatus Bathyarchaeia archaeon]
MKLILPNLKQAPKTTFFLKLADANGILQHSRFSSPEQVMGYSLDDNARGLIVAAWHYKLYRQKTFYDLIGKILNFIEETQIDDGRFHNYLWRSYGQSFFSHELAEDSFGETVWALGFLRSLGYTKNLDGKIDKIFNRCLPRILEFTGLRTKAYSLAGLCYYLRTGENLQVRKRATELAGRLIKQYQENRTADWRWFENILTYANAILPYSLFIAAKILGDRSLLKVASESFRFLIKVSTINNIPAPIGQRGWYAKRGNRAIYDQQPIEAGYLVLASLAAGEITGNKYYSGLAWEWFTWFHGKNLAGLSLIDKKDGGCYDGLEPWKVNLNKGAESSICYLLAYLALADNEK